MARILVVEDEADLREILSYNLSQAGHKVTLAELGREGLSIARAERPDLVLLDLMLPDMSGTDVCRQLKHDPRTRGTLIIMVTAKGEEIDRVVGFELGADDYVTKPFSVRELLLRIQAVLRRGEDQEIAAVFSAGDMRVDRDAHRAWIGDQEVTLTALEFKLLVTLYDRRGRVQTRERLLSDVWGIDADVTTRTVDTHVKRLREKLGPSGELIETVRGVGYRFSDEGTHAARGGA
jgi:two-component system, OmpR family, phosphate regulon response regulator PhoB